MVTNNEELREILIWKLLDSLNNGEKIDLDWMVEIDQIYFHNQNPLTTLKTLKKNLMDTIENSFDDLISRQNPD
jgi:hypothetical protein